MTRYVSILLLFFMLSPMFTPLAGAMDTCGQECAVGEHHECRHGKTCPMHKKKEAQTHGGHEGHHHKGHHEEGVNTGKSLICTVSDTGEDEAEPSKEGACFIMSDCSHGNDPVSAVIGSEYIVSKDHFKPFKNTGFIKPVTHDMYQGPEPFLPERPPSA